MFDKRINRLAASVSGNPVWGGRKGIEKESLRVTPQGHLSRKPHPLAFGSALTNRYITTDFSEALLEFVTPAFVHTWETLRFLCDIHQFSYAGLGDELLWVSSMPCRIGGDDDNRAQGHQHRGPHHHRRLRPQRHQTSEGFDAIHGMQTWPQHTAGRQRCTYMESGRL